MTAPDLAGTIRGYRTFRLAFHSDPARPPDLVSLLGRHTWTAGWNYAHHRPCDDGCELGPGAHCGMYAYWRPEAVHPTFDPILAVVDGAGSTVLHRHAFRASRMRIVAISLPSPSSMLRADAPVLHVAPAAAALGVPLMSRDDFCAAYPPEDVAALGVPASPRDREAGFGGVVGRPALPLYGAVRGWAQCGGGGAIATAYHTTAAARKAADELAANLSARLDVAATAEAQPLAAFGIAADAPASPDARVREQALAAQRSRNTGPRREPHRNRGRAR